MGDMFWLLALLIWLFGPRVVRANELKIFNQNVHGLPPRINQRLVKVVDRAKEEKSDLVLLQEIVFKKSLDKIDISGYTSIYFDDWKGMIDGDLAVLVKNDLKDKVRGEFIRFKNQGQWWGLIFPDRWLVRGYLRLCWKDNNFCVINTHLTAKYVPWMNFKLQEEQLRQIIEENKDKRFVIAGDYNLRSLEKFRDVINLSKELSSSMVEHDIKIDHVLTNMGESEGKTEVSYVYYSDWVSDHKGIMVNLVY
jgi:exonuclease III